MERPVAATADGPPARATRSTVLSIAEALRSEVGGEVVVKAGTETGRVFVARGKIAWATASTIPLTFGARLVDSGLVSRSDLVSAFEEARRTGRNFAETIVEWKLLGIDALRRELLAHVAAAFLEVLYWRNAIGLFVPSNRAYQGSITFHVPEILDAADAAGGPSRRVPEDVRAELASEHLSPTLAPAIEPATAPALEPATAPAPPPPGLPSPPSTTVSAHLLRDNLGALAGYRGAGVFTPSGVILGADQPEGGADPTAVVAAAADLVATVRAAVHPVLGEPGELVLGAPGAILVLRNATVAGLGPLAAYVLLAEGGNVALARIQLDRLVPEVVAERA